MTLFRTAKEPETRAGPRIVVRFVPADLSLI